MIAAATVQLDALGWALVALPVLGAAFAANRTYGRLEQKVDSLADTQKAQADALLAQQDAQNKIMEALVVRLEALSAQFNQHALQDAANFGELRGLAHGQAASTSAT